MVLASVSLNLASGKRPRLNNSFAFLSLSHRLPWKVLHIQSGATDCAIKCMVCLRSARGLVEVTPLWQTCGSGGGPDGHKLGKQHLLPCPEPRNLVTVDSLSGSQQNLPSSSQQPCVVGAGGSVSRAENLPPTLSCLPGPLFQHRRPSCARLLRLQISQPGKTPCPDSGSLP